MLTMHFGGFSKSVPAYTTLPYFEKHILSLVSFIIRKKCRKTDDCFLLQSDLVTRSRKISFDFNTVLPVFYADDA